ncbi:MAG: DUF1802 family protein [Phormidium sp.]
MPSLTLDTALRLPAPDVEALVQGRSIVAMPKSFLNVGKVFALYPTDVSGNLLPVEQQYRSSFLTIAKNTVSQLHPEGVIIKAWARCELCQILDKSESLEVLSPLTIWTTEALQEIIAKRSYIFLAYLRVYSLPEPSVMFADSQGQFVGLSKSISVIDNSPVLSNTAFSQRRHQLENRIPPLHPELEELQSAITQLTISNLAANNLNERLKIFLGWNSKQSVKQKETNPTWITTIAALGNRSKQLDTGTSNYQAGTDFENVVRDSLEFLGFKVDYAHKGGAGGLDLFCSKPYPLVGECKAGKKIPNPTAVQLLNLGTLRLKNEELLKKATKLIIGPGEPTDQLEEAAKVHGMAIMNPETLEKLVKLENQYSGAVDLFKLKEYLKPGKSDDEVAKYINEIEESINLRSQVVQAVKTLMEQESEYSISTNDPGFTVTEIRFHYNATHKPTLTNNELARDLLIELSSPLTGYLGRKKGSDGSDRFYYLRDLVVENEKSI